MNCAGIVLCGGRSSRMGMPKAWLPFGEEVLLQRVVRIVREVVDPVVVVAAPDQDVPELPPEVTIVRDEVEGRGPLAGLAAGLAVLEGKADAAYLSSCDVPFLKPEFVRRVVSFLASFEHQPPVGERSSIAVPHISGQLHPLAAEYRLCVLPDVRQLLADGRRRLLDLYDIVPTRLIEPDELADTDPDCRSLRNLNTPAAYEEALRELASLRPG